MAHDSGSFDYKVIDSRIKTILDTRSVLDNTIQLAIPFVKATTTIQLPEYLGKDNVGFTLGLHAIDEDVKYEDMYADASDGDGSHPLIGYTYQPNKTNKKVYAKLPSTSNDNVRKFFDSSVGAASTDFLRTPPPGITQVKIGRNRNGLLAHGEISFVVPTLRQLEVLYRTFLIPGVGMVLEWGQRFANESENLLVPENMFPWYSAAARDELFYRLAKNELGLQEILDKYVYPTNGQYMWMFGRVANFSTNANTDGSFNCVVKIVGPSEDAWAYGVYSTVTPPRDPSNQLFCVNSTNSVAGYFQNTAESGTPNFKSVLDKVRSKSGEISLYNDWVTHVAYIENGNQKEGEPTKKDLAKNASAEKNFLDSRDAYYISWRFFVNVILNDPVVGLKSIFLNSGLSDDEVTKISLLRPYVHRQEGGLPVKVSDRTEIIDTLESFVGFNEHLRTIDPTTMIIVNPTAYTLVQSDPHAEIYKNFIDNSNPKTDLVLSVNGTFGVVTQDSNVSTNDQSGVVKDRGFLSTGIWLNHRAVIECMLGADTVMRGIVNLLDRMSAASGNYWNLVLDSADATSDESYNYTVIDANYRMNSDLAVKDFIDKVHTFNKYIRVEDNKLVGSELLECSVNLDLPKRLFSQIATLGLVQPDDLAKLQADSSPPDPTPETSSPLTGDLLDSLREMFSLTSLSPSSDSAQGPDLTILPKQKRVAVTCQSTVGVPVPADAGGAGGGTPPVDMKDFNEKQLEKQKELLEKEQKKKQQTAETCALCPTIAAPSTKKASAPEASFVLDNKPLQDFSISSGYIRNDQRTVHGATDMVAPLGSDVTAAKAGKVVKVIDRCKEGNANCGGKYGNHVIIEHANGYSTLYAHLLSVPTSIKDGVTVTAGTVIGKLGNTGASTAPHLHFELRKIDSSKPKGFSTIDTESLLVGNTPTPPTSAPKTEPVESADEKYKNVGIKLAQENTNEGIVRNTDESLTADGKAYCNTCVKRNEFIKQASKVIEIKTRGSQVFRGYEGLKILGKYVEPLPDYMIKRIRDMSDGNKSNAFGAAPSTLSISADMSMPGVNGLRVGELFWIDKVPSFYKAFGAFQIMSIEEVIDSAWTTNVHARFNYLGFSWRTSMAQILLGTNK